MNPPTNASNLGSITDRLVQEITARIVSELEPEAIILFASHAWGAPTKDSDIDLCIIVSDSIPGFDRMEWAIRADRCLEDLQVNADILVKTRSTVEEYRQVKGSLTHKILEEGTVLYGQSQAKVSSDLDYHFQEPGCHMVKEKTKKQLDNGFQSVEKAI